MSTELPRRPLSRPSSELLVDLHVYIVPKNSWNEKFRLAYNEVIHQTISCGFVRVWPDLTLSNLRNIIDEQLGDEALPKNYVFLRSVGRCLTQVRSKQEPTLKVKSFIPPQAYAPEIFILESKYLSLGSTSSTPQSLSDFGSGHDSRGIDNQLRLSRGDSGHLSSNHDRMDSEEPVEISEGSTAVPFLGKQKGKLSTTQKTINKIKEKSTDPADKSTPVRKSGLKGAQTSGKVSGKADSRIDGKTVRTGGRAGATSGGKVVKPVEKTQADQSGRKGTIEGSTKARDKLVSRLGAEGGGQGRSAAQQIADRHTGRETGLGPKPIGSNTTSSHAQSDNLGGGVSKDLQKDGLGKKAQQKGQASQSGQVQPGDQAQQSGQQSVRVLLAARKGLNMKGHPQTGVHSVAGAQGISLGTIMESQVGHNAEKVGHVMPGIRAPLSDRGPVISRGRSNAKSGGTRDIFTSSNNPSEDSGISDEAVHDGMDADYQKRMRDSLKGTELSLDTSSRNTSRKSQGKISRHSRRQAHSQHSRHSEVPLSRQDTDTNKEVEMASGLDLSTDAGPEDNGLEDSVDLEDGYGDEQENEKDVKAEMEEIRKKQAEELRLSRMRSQETSRNRGPRVGTGEADTSNSGKLSASGGFGRQMSYGNASTRDSPNSQMSQMNGEHRMRSEPSGNDNLLGADQEMGGRLTEVSNIADQEEEVGGVDGKEMGSRMTGDWNVQAAQDALQDLQLEDEQEEAENQDIDEDQHQKSQLSKECQRLIQELAETRAKREQLEQERADLVRKAKGSQAAMLEKRNKSRDVWKKKYFEEKKKTIPLEDQIGKMKVHVDQQHRKRLSQLEGRSKGATGLPSKKSDHKIAIIKINHAKDDVQRMVENAQLRLASEIKLRNQAENELRNLRAEVMQRKIHVSLTRSQHQIPVVAEPGNTPHKASRTLLSSRTSRNTPQSSRGQSTLSYKGKTAR